MIAPDTLETIKTLALITGQASLWGTLAGWRIMRWVSNWPPETKAKIAAWSPKWYGRLDFLAGLFPNDKQMKRGLLKAAKLTHQASLEELVESYPDDAAEDEITLTPAAPLIIPIVLPKTEFPPPPPEAIAHRPRVDGRHSLSGENLPPEASETIGKK